MPNRRMKDESALWDYLRLEIFNRNKHHLCRIENHSAGPGFPDVEFCINSCVGHLELKHCFHDGKNPFLRPTQHRWITDRINAGATNVWLLLAITWPTKTEFVMVHGGKSKYLIGSVSLREWKYHAARIWDTNIVKNEIIMDLTRSKS